MTVIYSDELKKKVVRLKLEGRSISSLSQEYGAAKSTIAKWVARYKASSTPEREKVISSSEEIARLKRLLAEKEKEILFLKKAAAFFAREIEPRN